MHFLLTIACFVLTAHVHGAEMFFNDEATYNPCVDGSGVFFYPHRADIQKYYQCDEYGNAYLRTCGSGLVWDELGTTCNWPSAIAPRSPLVVLIPTITTRPTLPTTATTTLASPPCMTTTSFPPVTTTTTPRSPIVASSFSLCQPVNPCGEHGKCLESSTTLSKARQRFACICSENWFGRLCDKQIVDLTTPPVNFDQNSNNSHSTNTFALPVKTEEDAKYIFYGLSGSSKVEKDNTLKDSAIPTRAEVSHLVKPNVSIPLNGISN